MLHPDELRAIAEWCHANGVRLVSDEIYHGLQYGAAPAAFSPGAAAARRLSQPAQRHGRAGQVATASAFSPSAIVINSFSKYFGMTGWRVGWMVLPDDLIRPVECLAQNMFISAPHISQIAAEASFGCHDELRDRVAGYARSRALLMAALPEMGFASVAPAQGAFYLYADVSDRTNDSQAFCARMLAEAGIAAASGVDFDMQRGHRALRFSYCGPEADIAEAAERLKRWR